MNNRQAQMQWLLALTALSLVPVYVLTGWQSGGHSPAEITDWLKWFWRIEAGAWGLRALVESAALMYLFQTVTANPLRARIIVFFEFALIGLIALTIGLVIISNGQVQNGDGIARVLPGWLYWCWSFGVAAFAPLMMGSVGFAYKVHEPVSPTISEDDTLRQRVDTLSVTLNTLAANVTALTVNPVSDRRERVLLLKQEGLTQSQIAEQMGVSVSTIRQDVKALNGRAK